MRNYIFFFKPSPHCGWDLSSPTGDPTSLPLPPALVVQSLKHWTATEAPVNFSSLNHPICGALLLQQSNSCESWLFPSIWNVMFSSHPSNTENTLHLAWGSWYNSIEYDPPCNTGGQGFFISGVQRERLDPRSLSWLRMCLQCGRPRFKSWVRKIPWRRDSLPTPVF